MTLPITKIISNPNFGARVGTLYDLYANEDEVDLEARSILTFLFDDVPLPAKSEDSGDGGRADDGPTDPDGFAYAETIVVDDPSENTDPDREEE